MNGQTNVRTNRRTDRRTRRGEGRREGTILFVIRTAAEHDRPLGRLDRLVAR